jgi:hypothetical protein
VKSYSSRMLQFLFASSEFFAGGNVILTSVAIAVAIIIITASLVCFKIAASTSVIFIGRCRSPGVLFGPSDRV